jgi:hypothetical protein
MHSCFTTPHYIDLLKKMKERDFRFLFFTEFDSALPSGNAALLRHDVDVSIKYAHRLAEIECMQNVKSTYFFLLTSPLYNISEPTHLRMISEIIQMGHQVGLHYDNKATNRNDELNKIRNEANILSSILNVPIHVFSYHRPSASMIKDWNNSSREKIDLLNAYSSDYLSNFKYISDSNHDWREGCLSEHIDSHQRLYILTHPIWWVHEDVMAPTEKIFHFVKALTTSNIDVLANNIIGYKHYLSGSTWN